MKYDVFISYRRNGGDKFARTIQQALEKQFRVFLDYDELEDGVFDQRIIEAIKESSVFLLILSKGALDRCIYKDDWVRQEILQAVRCGCHIVPVTIIGDNFNRLPDNLPDELRRAIGSHQFSQIHFETLFNESMAKLVKTRISPYIHRAQTKTGAEIHIEADAECQLYHFKKMLERIYVGEDNVVRLRRGKHKLEFVSVEFEDIRDQQILEVPDDDYTDFIEVKMKERIIAKRIAEEEDAKRMAANAQKVKAHYSNCSFSISAGSDIGLFQPTNDDDFFVSPNLSTSTWMMSQGGNFVDHGKLGALLVVADGENDGNGVASAIAIETVQKRFVPKSLKRIIYDPEKIKCFMIDVLKNADIDIYKQSYANKSNKGMYASIVMAYVLHNKLYFSWCGNCRCYVLNKTYGLIRLTKDHTYGEDLVDKGVISQDQVNNHPLSNKITRCLGNLEKTAQPEVRVYELHNDDLVMLCSDGLFFMCDDYQILDTMIKFEENLSECKNELIKIALSNGGHDNVTIALLKAKIKME